MALVSLCSAATRLLQPVPVRLVVSSRATTPTSLAADRVALMVLSADCCLDTASISVVALVSSRHLSLESNQLLQYTIRLGIAHSDGRAHTRSRPRSQKGTMDMPKIQPMSKKLIEVVGSQKMVYFLQSIGLASFPGNTLPSDILLCLSRCIFSRIWLGSRSHTTKHMNLKGYLTLDTLYAYPFYCRKHS